MKNIEALYIHIPFCDHICVYCDFYKMIANKDTQDKYIDYLIKELKIRKEYLKDLKTIYIGGGTPSTLTNYNLVKLLEAIKEEVNLNNILEYTIEANPNDINDLFIETIIKYNINRISLGVQSLDNNKLKFLRRNHNKDIVINALELLNKYNFNNINCDLIYGVNNDTIELIKNDIDLLLKYNVKHISCYSLIIENKTILNKMIKEQNYKIMDDDLDASIYNFISNYFNELGFNHYEISNYAINGYESKHNLTYWNNDYYLGIGANASYYFNNTRYTNYDNLNKYFNAIDNYKNKLNTKDTIELDQDDQMYEFVMLGLRKLKGISKSEFINRYNINIFEKYNNIKSLINSNVLIENDDFISINKDKIYIMNDILNKILE